MRTISCREAEEIASRHLEGQRMEHGGGGTIVSVSFDDNQQRLASDEDQLHTSWRIHHDDGHTAGWGFSFGVKAGDVRRWAAEDQEVDVNEILLWFET